MSNTQIVQQSPKLSALNLMSSKFSVEPAKLLETLKSTVFKGATNEELLALVVVANTYGLNPLTKEIYAFPAKGGGIVPVVSVDGWIRMVNDHPQMDGIEFSDTMENGELISVTCRIYRKDRSRPTMVTEYTNECRRNTEPWKMVHRMMRHKALIQCARVAFGFSGIQDEDEAKDAVQSRVATGRVVDETAKLENPYAEAPQATLEDAAPLDPQPTAEEPLESPVEVSEATEREQLLGDIRDTLSEVDMKTAKFAPLCREAGILASGVQIIDAPIESLRTIHNNRLAIAQGTYKAEVAP
jgi:phage recombination protein Bet